MQSIKQQIDQLPGTQEKSRTQTGENTYRSLFNSIDEGFCIVEVLFENDKPVDYLFLEANAAFEEQTGMYGAVGRTMKEIAPSHEQHWFEIYGRIAKTGVPERFQNKAEALNRFFEVYAFRIDDPQLNNVAILFKDITHRKETEEQQLFILKINDTLRSLTDAEEIQTASADLLGKFLKVNQAHYSEVIDGNVIIQHSYAKDTPEIKGTFPEKEFGELLLKGVKSGTLQVCNDLTLDAKHSEDERQFLMSANIGAYIAVPIIKNEEWKATFAVHNIKPRKWKQNEIDLVQDVAERTWVAVEKVKAENALRKSEEKYRTLFNTIAIGYTVAEAIRDEDGKMINYRFVELNPAFEKQTGLNGPSTVGKTAWEVLPNLDRVWFETYQKVIDTKIPLRTESFVDPLERWYDISAFYYDKEQFAVYFDDITARKVVELRQTYLLKLNDALRPLGDASSIITTACRIMGEYLDVMRVMYANYIVDNGEEFYKLAGQYTSGISFSTEAIAARNFRAATDNFKAVKISVVNNLFEEIPENERPAYLQFHIQSFVAVPLIKNGKLVFTFAAHHNKPRKWKAYEIQLVEETAERIWLAIEKAKAEEALSHFAARFTIALESAHMGAWDWDVENDEIILNEQLNILFGLQPETVKTTIEDFLSNIHKNDRQQLKNTLSAVSKTGEIFNADFRFTRADTKETRWMFIYGSNVKKINDTVVHMAGVMFDITDRKKLEQQKEEFLGIASHELKTPVTSIKAYGQLLQRKFENIEDKASRQMLQKMNAQVNRLDRLIHDLLDTTRIAEGHIVLDYSQFNIVALIKELVEEHQDLSYQHNITINAQQVVNVTADKKRMEQVITNIISNAIKYSPGGGEIVITCTRLQNEIYVSVADNGVGVPEDLSEKIFDRFYRVDNSTAHTYPGIGLGLYITAGIIKRHNGTIGVKANKPQGSVFYFTLPLKQ